jgi:N-sulfoglucosamine sulfohydrolase
MTSLEGFRMLLCVGLVALAMQQSAAAELEKRNVILYVVDDQGMEDAGCYGNEVIRTPGLDRLAASGTRLTHAFCTTPSCSASRSVIMTGLHNHATGQYGHSHSFNHFRSFENFRSLPVRLNEAGYRTLCAGKFHVAPEPVYHFQESIQTMEPALMAEQCRALIEADSDRPFFLYFCTVEPHRWFLREGSAPIDPAEVIVPDYLPDTPESRTELAEYYMSVERADRGLLALLNILEASGHSEDTLVIYISDNGVAFPGAKTNVYEPGVRLPCVVRNPFAEKSLGVSDAMVTYADLTPTILDFARAEYDAGDFHGRSFLSDIQSPNPVGRDEVFLSHTFHEITMYYPMRVVRERRYKLIWNIAHGLSFPTAADLFASPTWKGVLARGDHLYGKRTLDAYLNRAAFELYDLEDDPDEIENLASREEHQERLARMQQKMRAAQKRTQDPWRVKWNHE